jgi:hypothetical protein
LLTGLPVFPQSCRNKAPLGLAVTVFSTRWVSPMSQDAVSAAW